MDSSEIDFSKENIQPLKEGRLASYLGTALNAQCDINSQNEILKGREKFELELRKYKGDDPLEVWYNYICWVIQSYPNTEMGHLAPLLHKCLAIFKDDERYLQDSRYVRLWIKYIQMQNDPIETYEMAHKHGIGNKSAEFYKSWAEEYEKSGDFKGATSIFNKGYNYGAQPASDLAFYQRNFEDRVARHLAQKADDDWGDQNNAEESRQVLSSLAVLPKSRERKKGTVGSVRTGAAIVGPAGLLKQSNSACKEQKPSSQFQIFFDQGGADSRSRVKLDTLPSGTVTNRENIIKPGKWTQQSASKRPAFSEVMHGTPFKVHEDTTTNQGVATPRGESFSENVLKPRKAIKDEFDCPLYIFEAPDPTKIPMYCKDKVYSGGVEFSLEEIRAIRYIEAEKKKQKDLVKREENMNPLDDYVDKNKESSPQSRTETNNFQAGWSSSEDLLAPSAFTTPRNDKPDGHQLQDERGVQNVANRFLGGPLQHLDCSSYPSPTINTRAANAMMNELWSTTFTQSLGDSLLVAPPQSHSNASKFEIPFDENTVFQEIPEPEEKAKRIQLQPKFTNFKIHFDKDSIFQDEPNSEDKEMGLLSSEAVSDDWGSHIPFVPPPKDDIENVLEDESKENCIPPDYQSSHKPERRALSGILVPSTNVAYQELDSDSKDQEACDQSETEIGDNRRRVLAMASSNLSDGINTDTFERQMLISLNEGNHGSNGSKKRKITVNEDRKTNTFSQDENGGVIFRQTHVHRTLETEIAPASSTSNTNWVPQEMFKNCSNEVVPNKNNLPSNPDCESFWGKTTLSNFHNFAEPGRYEVVEDPCAHYMLETILNKVSIPVCRTSNVYRINQKVPFLKGNDELNLRQGLKLKILKVISTNGDAKLYLAVNDDGEHVVIKFQEHKGEWEFYIFREIRSRLANPQMNSAFANIIEMYLFHNDASMMLMEYHPNGTFLDMLNIYKLKQQTFPEVLVLYFTIDIINTVKHLHGCKIIHGAVKPENLLIREFPRIPERWNEDYFCNRATSLQLINYGRSIDMTQFSNNVHFVSTTTDNTYECKEIQTGRHWTYQVDFYSLAFTIHCMIFGEFLNASCSNGTWFINRKIPGNFNARVWNNLFHSFLNIPSCETMPDLENIINELQDFMLSFKLDTFQSALSTMKHLLQESIKRK